MFRMVAWRISICIVDSISVFRHSTMNFCLCFMFSNIFVLCSSWILEPYCFFGFNCSWYCESYCSWTYIYNTVVDVDILFLIRPPCYVFQGVDRNFGVWLMAASLIWPQLKSFQKKRKINPEKTAWSDAGLGWCGRRSWQIVIQFSSVLCHLSRWWLISLAPAKVIYQFVQSQKGWNSAYNKSCNNKKVQIDTRNNCKILLCKIVIGIERKKLLVYTKILCFILPLASCILASFLVNFICFHVFYYFNILGSSLFNPPGHKRAKIWTSNNLQGQTLTNNITMID